MKLGIDVRWLHEAYRNALCQPEHHSDLHLPPVEGSQPYGGLGGVGRYVKELLPPLAACLHDSKAVLFFLDDSDVPEELVALWNGAEVRTLPHNWRPKGAGWGVFGRAHNYVQGRSVARRVRDCALDLFFSPHQLVIPDPDWAHHRVVTCHDLAYLEYPSFFFKNAKLPGSYRALYDALAGCERLIAVSGATAASLEESLGIPSERITVTHEGVAPAFREERKPYQPGWPYLLHVGGAGPGKNLSRVVEAWRMVCDHGVHIHLILSGVTPDQVNAFAGSQKVGTLQGLHCVPSLHDCQLNALYRGAELLLFPSIVEGFGLPVAEAMACGCPVVTSKTSPMEEVAGNAALFVDPNSTSEIVAASERIMADRALRRSLIEQGKIRARQLTWERTAERTAHILREQANHSSRSRQVP
jgi:glycosyltransferase involved in cell wall biosynthesis